MSTQTTFHDPRPELGSSQQDVPRLASKRRRRSTPWIVLGVLLVVGCGLASAVVVGRAGQRLPVLAVTRDLPAGHVLSASDVGIVRVAAGGEVATVSAASRSEVVGRMVAVPLRSGSLLSPKVLGPAAYPPQGYAVVGAALEPGRYPPGLVRGAAVLVVATPEAAAGSGAAVTVEGSSARATVVGIRAGGAQHGQPMVVSLLVSVEDAEQVARAAAAGQVSVVEVPAGGE